MKTCLSQHLTQQVWPNCACIDVLHNWAPYNFQYTWPTSFVCVKLIAAVHGELGSAAQCNFHWISCLSKQWQAVCMRPNYIKHPDALALVLCTFERCTGTWAHMLRFQCTPVTRSICIIRWSSDRWAGLRSMFHHQLMMFSEQNIWVSNPLSCAALYDHQVIMFHKQMSQSSAPYAASVTQFCLHWCSARLSAVLTFSPHWSQGLCVESDEAVLGELGSAIFHQLVMFDQHIQLCSHWFYAHLSDVPEPGHICWGSSAQRSHRLYHQIQQWLMIWYVQHPHHQLMMFLTILSQSAATMSNECQHIKHTFVLALMFCTSERCTWTGHIWSGLWTAVTRSLCTCLYEAAADELGSAAYCIISLL